MKLGDVTLVHGCMIYREEVILMARKDSKRELPEKGTTLPEVCPKCREKYLKEGILIVNPNTGSLVVIKDEAFKNIMVNSPVPKGRVCFAEEGVVEHILKMYEEAKDE